MTDLSSNLNLSDQLIISAVTSFLLERLKKSDKFPLLTQHTDALNRLFSYAINLSVQIGIAITWSGSLNEGGVLTITVPSIWTMYELAKGLVVQEGVYRKFFKQDAQPIPIPPIKWAPTQATEAKVEESTNGHSVASPTAGGRT